MRASWAAVLLIAGLAGCASTQSSEPTPIEAPQWQAGHAFAFDVFGEVQAEYLLRVDGQVEEQDGHDVTIPQQPAMVVEILNTSHDGAYLGAARLGEAMQFTLHGAQGMLGKAPIAFRHRDLAPLPVATSHVERCDPGCRLAMSGFQVQPGAMDTYLAFPLVPEKNWRSSVSLESEVPGLFVVVESTVIGIETVEGPGGPVDAVRVEHDLRLPFDAASAGAFAQAGGVDGDFDFDLEGGITTWYAPSVLSVVREHTQFRMHFDADLTVEGKRVEMNMKSHVDVTTLLAGFDLQPREELDEAGVLAFFDGVAPLKDPTQAALGAYTIRVGADVAQFNVADGHQGSFSVSADPALPDDHTVRYSIVDPTGDLLDSGTGTEFTARFEKAGLHEVFVQSVGSTGVVEAIDSIIVAADYEATTVLSCGDVILPVTGSCTSVRVPLDSTFGLERFEVSIESDALAREGGTLTLRDLAGTKVTTDGTPITLEDIGRLRPGAWTAAWAPDVALQEDASVSVVMDYGPTAAPTPVPEDGALHRFLRHAVDAMAPAELTAR